MKRLLLILTLGTMSIQVQTACAQQALALKHTKGFTVAAIGLGGLSVYALKSAKKLSGNPALLARGLGATYALGALWCGYKAYSAYSRWAWLSAPNAEPIMRISTLQVTQKNNMDQAEIDFFKQAVPVEADRAICCRVTHESDVHVSDKSKYRNRKKAPTHTAYVIFYCIFGKWCAKMSKRVIESDSYLNIQHIQNTMLNYQLNTLVDLDIYSAHTTPTGIERFFTASGIFQIDFNSHQSSNNQWSAAPSMYQENDFKIVGLCEMRKL